MTTEITPIKLIVFDMAGTTVEDDHQVAFALQHALKKFGFDYSIEAINVVMGYAKPLAITKLLEKFNAPQHLDGNLIDQIHHQFVNEMISFYATSSLVKEKENATEIFQVLRSSGIKVAIDTGFSRPIADTIFRRLGWIAGQHYDVSITSDEVENGRPYPDMIYRAMELCEVTDKSQVAKIGDTASDLQQGTAAGCQYVIGVTTGAYTREALLKEQHTHLINNLQEILSLLEIEHYSI